MSLIVTVTGPTASGKTTLVKHLLSLPDSPYRKCISHTTRPPRLGEVHGRDYFFVSQAEFDNTEMLESNIYDSYWYGTSQAEYDRILKLEFIPLFVVDYNGVHNLKCKDSIPSQHEYVSVFVYTNEQDIFRRMIERVQGGTIDVDHAVMRLSNYTHEEKEWLSKNWSVKIYNPNDITKEVWDQKIMILDSFIRTKMLAHAYGFYNQRGDKVAGYLDI